MVTSEMETTVDSCPDPILGILIDLIEQHETADTSPVQPVTLQVHGFLVSGNIISADRYALEMDELNDGSLFKDLLGVGSGEPELDQDEQDQVAPFRRFIHMNDVRIFRGLEKPIPSRGGLLWRGRLDQVAGFFLGKLEVNEAAT